MLSCLIKDVMISEFYTFGRPPWRPFSYSFFGGEQHAMQELHLERFQAVWQFLLHAAEVPVSTGAG